MKPVRQNHTRPGRIETIEIIRRTKGMSSIVVEEVVPPDFLERLGKLPVYEIKDGKRVRCEGETISFEQVPERGE